MVQIVGFGVASALTITAIEGVVTCGFRVRPDTARPEVRMVGTAHNFFSVGLGVGTAAAVGHLIQAWAAWPVAAAAATGRFAPRRPYASGRATGLAVP